MTHFRYFLNFFLYYFQVKHFLLKDSGWKVYQMSPSWWCFDALLSWYVLEMSWWLGGLGVIIVMMVMEGDSDGGGDDYKNWSLFRLTKTKMSQNMAKLTWQRSRLGQEEKKKQEERRRREDKEREEKARRQR